MQERVTKVTERKKYKPKRSTPLRDRAVKAGVSDRLQATPADVLVTIHTGSPSSSPVKQAKKRLQAVQKANHQIVARAEQQMPRNAEQKRASNEHASAKRWAKRQATKDDSTDEVDGL